MDATLSTELAAVAADLHAEPDVERTVKGVLQHARAIAGGDCAGVMFVRGHRVDPMLASAPEAERADQLQLKFGDGPGIAAMSGDDAVVVDEVSTDPRWPRWTGPVAGMGLRSSVSMRLGTHGATLGVLNLYSTRAGQFAGEHLTLARLYARHASVAVASARHESGLRQAMDARHVIGQAQGILMERYGMDAAKAFTLLRRSARHHNVKLSERAAAVVNTRRLSDLD